MLDGSERRCHIVLQVRGHRPHGVGYLGELCELGVERAEGKEILANRDGLLRSVKYGTYERPTLGAKKLRPIDKAVRMSLSAPLVGCGGSSIVTIAPTLSVAADLALPMAA